MKGKFLCEIHNILVRIKQIQRNHEYARVIMTCDHFFRVKTEEIYNGKYISYLTPEAFRLLIADHVENILSMDGEIRFHRLVTILSKIYRTQTDEIEPIVFAGARQQKWFIDRSDIFAVVVDKDYYNNHPEHFEIMQFK